MRKINTSDVFKMARILKKGNVEENIANAVGEMTESKGKKMTEKIGIKIMLILFESCGDNEVESMIYELIGGIAEVSPDIIAEQPFEDTLKLLQSISEHNDIKGFFKQAGQLI